MFSSKSRVPREHTSEFLYRAKLSVTLIKQRLNNVMDNIFHAAVRVEEDVSWTTARIRSALFCDIKQANAADRSINYASESV